MFSTKLFFALAKENNIEPFMLMHTKSTSLSLRVYQGKLEGNTLANDEKLVGRGIYQSKTGSFISDRCDASIAPEMIKYIKESAEYGLLGNPDYFIAPGMTYKKVNRYHKSLSLLKTDEIIALLKAISDKIAAKDKRIKVVEVAFDLTSSQTLMENSKGLKLKEKENYAIIYVSIKIADKEEVESYSDYRIITDLNDFRQDEFIDEVVSEGIKKIGGTSLPSGKYDVLFSEDAIASLIKAMLGNFSYFAVEKHLSLFCDKLGRQIFSPKLTLTENPHTKTVFGSCFDAEGMPTTKKELIAKGILKTFVYDLDTAARASVASTGNATFRGGNIRPGVGFVEVKPGDRDMMQIIQNIKKGIYITDLNGIGTGLNRQSGNYSLQAEGFYIEGGKIIRPVSLITVAGNLLTDFNKIEEIGTKSKLVLNGISTPVVLIPSLMISGNL